MIHELIFLLPELTIFIGITVLLLTAIKGDSTYSTMALMTTVVILVVAMVQVIIISHSGASSFLGSTFGADRLISFGQVALLALASLFTLNLNFLGKAQSIEVGILTLLSTLFGMVALAASNWLLVLLCLIGVVWSAIGVAAQDESKDVRPKVIFRLIPTTLVILLVGFFTIVFLFMSANGINIEQVEKFLAKEGNPSGPIVLVECLIAILLAGHWGGFFFENLIPTAGRKILFVSFSRQFVALVGVLVFFKWGLGLFTHASLEPKSLSLYYDPMVLLGVRALAAVGIVGFPFWCLFSKSLKRIMQLSLLVPFSTVVFVGTFLKSDLLAVSLGTLLFSVLAWSTAVVSFTALKIPDEGTLGDLTGLGRQRPALVIGFLISLTALLNLVPFVGSVATMWTHRISDVWSVALLVSNFLATWLVARITAIMFQSAPANQSSSTNLKISHRVMLLVQFMLLILLGIYWKPLFNYGLFSVKNFFE